MFHPSVYYLYYLIFLRCPSNITKSHEQLPQPISCLSHDHGDLNSSSVIFIVPSWPDSSPWHDECKLISSAVVPIPIPNKTNSLFSPDLNNDLELSWSQPTCGECVARGQVCGLTEETSLQVGCFSTSNKSPGLPRSAKYGLIIGVGIPGLLCIIGLCCYICGKFTVRVPNYQARPIIELPAPIVAIQSLDGSEIEKFPKTLIGESGRLPNSNDHTCPICLSEYEPKEILRTIPACNHYFHAHCVDEWLKMNATCPLCRNSPDASSSSSSTVTPSSSLSIYSSHSS